MMIPLRDSLEVEAVVVEKGLITQNSRLITDMSSMLSLETKGVTESSVEQLSVNYPTVAVNYPSKRWSFFGSSYLTPPF